MNKLEILNSLEIEEYEADGSTLYYVLIQNSVENREKLMQIGVAEEEIQGVLSIDGEFIDISGFGFNQGGAKWFHPDYGGWIDYEPVEGEEEYDETTEIA